MAAICGRRFVALVACAVFAAQLGFSLHATGHATADGSASCQVCLSADQPLATTPPPKATGAAAIRDMEPQPVGGERLTTAGFFLPPSRGPPTHS